MFEFTITQMIFLLVVFLLYYFIISYRFSCTVDKKLHRHQKKLLRKISSLYKYFNNDTQEQRRMMNVREHDMREHGMREQHGMREHEKAMNRRQYNTHPLIEDSEEDSIQGIGENGDEL